MIPNYTCVWCSKEKTIFSVVALCDHQMMPKVYLCNDCIISLAGQFLRGRHEFETAKAVEKFIGHKLPFEVDMINREKLNEG